MQSLVPLLRGLVEIELTRAVDLSDHDTWHGPRADAVRTDLAHVRRILLAAIDLAERNHRSPIDTARSSCRPWGC